MGRIVGIDYGRKRIGLAISDPDGKIASPLTTREESAPPHEAVRQLVLWIDREYEVDAFVVGLPLNMDGTEGTQAQQTRRFANALRTASNRPVHLHDERLTSWSADQAMSDAGLTRDQRKARVDRVAAQMILQSFLDQAQSETQCVHELLSVRRPQIANSVSVRYPYEDMGKKPKLTIASLKTTANEFAVVESLHGEPTLYGVTDGKAVGTYLELKFRKYLLERYTFLEGNAASGIDLPELLVDLKTTSILQPQSSCPFKSGRQKVFGLGYSLLVFVYEKTDDHDAKTGRLAIQHVVFVDAAQTGDYQMTRGLREVVERNGNIDDLMAFMMDKNLPVDEIELRQIAEEVLSRKPEQGYLTISNALQWRLQYSRVIEQAGVVAGVIRVK